MSFFNRQGRALLLAAVVAVGAVCVSCGTAGRASAGRGAKDGQADTLANIEEKQSGKVRVGSFTDSRDGKTYKWVVIGEQTWMAENLNYLDETGRSWCYEDDNSNCEEYGRLYSWRTATTACPSGWHLPSRSEWQILVDYTGRVDGPENKLRSGAYWIVGESGSNGTDEFGFSALPGGGRLPEPFGKFYSGGDEGVWWTATEEVTRAYGQQNGSAYGRYMDFGDYLNGSSFDVGSGFSVRCLGD